MRYRSGAKPSVPGKFTPKAATPQLRGQDPEVEHEMSAQEHPVSVQPVEPENPRKTGSSKPAQQKILEHNAQTGQLQEHPETVAGQHATGSFTDKKRRAS
jgi:hypothetical protein